MSAGGIDVEARGTEDGARPHRPVVPVHSLVETSDETLVIVLAAALLERVGIFVPDGEVLRSRATVVKGALLIEVERQVFAVADVAPVVGWALRNAWPVEAVVFDEVGEAVAVWQLIGPGASNRRLASVG